MKRLKFLKMFISTISLLGGVSIFSASAMDQNQRENNKVLSDQNGKNNNNEDTIYKKLAFARAFLNTLDIRRNQFIKRREVILDKINADDVKLILIEIDEKIKDLDKKIKDTNDRISKILNDEKYNPQTDEDFMREYENKKKYEQQEKDKQNNFKYDLEDLLNNKSMTVKLNLDKFKTTEVERIFDTTIADMGLIHFYLTSKHLKDLCEKDLEMLERIMDIRFIKDFEKELQGEKTKKLNDIYKILKNFLIKTFDTLKQKKLFEEFSKQPNDVISKGAINKNKIEILNKEKKAIQEEAKKYMEELDAAIDQLKDLVKGIVNYIEELQENLILLNNSKLKNKNSKYAKKTNEKIKETRENKEKTETSLKDVSIQLASNEIKREVYYQGYQRYLKTIDSLLNDYSKVLSGVEGYDVNKEQINKDNYDVEQNINKKIQKRFKKLISDSNRMVYDLKEEYGDIKDTERQIVDFEKDKQFIDKYLIKYLNEKDRYKESDKKNEQIDNKYMDLYTERLEERTLYSIKPNDWENNFKKELDYVRRRREKSRNKFYEFEELDLDMRRELREKLSSIIEKINYYSPFVEKINKKQKIKNDYLIKSKKIKENLKKEIENFNKKCEVEINDLIRPIETEKDLNEKIEKFQEIKLRIEKIIENLFKKKEMLKEKRNDLNNKFGQNYERIRDYNIIKDKSIINNKIDLPKPIDLPKEEILMEKEMLDIIKNYSGELNKKQNEDGDILLENVIITNNSNMVNKLEEIRSYLKSKLNKNCRSKEISKNLFDISYENLRDDLSNSDKIAIQKYKTDLDKIDYYIKIKKINKYVKLNK